MTTNHFREMPFIGKLFTESGLSEYTATTTMGKYKNTKTRIAMTAITCALKDVCSFIRCLHYFVVLQTRFCSKSVTPSKIKTIMSMTIPIAAPYGELFD